MIKLSELKNLLRDQFNTRLANASALPILSLLGLVSGIVVGLLIVLLRLMIEWSQAAFLPSADPENYEALSWLVRAVYLLVGSLILAIIYAFFRKTSPRVGVIHVLERLAYHEGHLPLKNTVLQFFGSAIAIVSGHSVGREGPSIHVGAGIASYIGQKLRLPNNSIRNLVACGAAAAIAGSFNTPLAGVIFAMEVVLMEYTIAGFTPIILAAVSATAISRTVFHTEPIFLVPAFELASLSELLVIVVMGCLIGGFSAIFITTVKKITSKSQDYHISLRIIFAGILLSVISAFVPEVMSIGYDTVNKALIGDLTISILFFIALAKLIATSISIGLGVPGGVIGPTIVMGALLGAFVGQVSNLIAGTVSDPGLYAMLGMGAMMGATLQAPLAALIALLELTGNQNIIFPGMLAIVTANLAARELFGQESVFISQMKQIGLDYRNDPIAQSLRRFAVASVMNKDFLIVNSDLTLDQARKLLVNKPKWLVIRREEKLLLMPAVDLVRYLEETTDENLDLLEVPSKRLQLQPVMQQATLQQALKLLDSSESEALYVIQRIGAAADRIYGIVTRHDIEQSYHRKDNGF